VKHYLITRYNAPVFPTRPDLHHLQLDENWLLQRTELFLAYTYPSVCAQTAQEFEWIIWCHPDSPKWLRETMLYRCQRANVVYDTNYKDHIDRDTDILITTRLDNDDMIHRDFIALTQHNIAEFRRTGLHRVVHTFTKGYRYMPDRELLREANQTNSPFMSLFVQSERVGDEDWHVYCNDHGKMPDLFPTFFNTDLRAWCWLQHKNNTASIAATEGSVIPVKKLEEFGL
jgi:hypothetical protein